MVYDFPSLNDESQLGDLVQQYQIEANPHNYYSPKNDKMSDVIGEKKVLKIKSDKGNKIGSDNFDSNQDSLPIDNLNNDIPSPQSDDMSNTNDNSSEFDTNFDAGLDADENSDPKKYIQQLSGKLSQSLRNYNQNQNDPDLNKYVAGMIVTQAAEGLEDNDKDEIISKIQNSSNNDENMNNSNMNGMDNMGDDIPLDDVPPMECVRFKKKIIKENEKNLDEIINDLFNDQDRPNNFNVKPDRKSYKKKPFINKLMN